MVGVQRTHPSARQMAIHVVMMRQTTVVKRMVMSMVTVPVTRMAQLRQGRLKATADVQEWTQAIQLATADQMVAPRAVVVSTSRQDLFSP